MFLEEVLLSLGTALGNLFNLAVLKIPELLLAKVKAHKSTYFSFSPLQHTALNIALVLSPL